MMSSQGYRVKTNKMQSDPPPSYNPNYRPPPQVPLPRKDEKRNGKGGGSFGGGGGGGGGFGGPFGGDFAGAGARAALRRYGIPQYRNDLPWQQKLLWFTAALAGMAAWYFTPVSDLATDYVLQQVPLSADYELGRQALEELPYRTVYSPTWTNVLQSVGNELIRTFETDIQKTPSAPPTPHAQQFGASAPPMEDYDSNLYHWDIAIIHADFINAFALPGGVIRVTDTLLDMIKPTRGELAALLGHEMGHVIHRHSQGRLLQQQLIQWIIKALEYEDGSTKASANNLKKGTGFGQALGNVLTQSAWWLGQQRFSRRDEYQADAISWQLLAAPSNSFNPQSLHSLLSKLDSLEDKSASASGSKSGPMSSSAQAQPPATKSHDTLPSKVAEWTRTHPYTKDRIKALDEKWYSLPDRERRRLSYNKI